MATPPNAARGFAALRLTPERFADYKKNDHSSDLYKRPSGAAKPIKVVGYGQDAIAAIKVSNDEGKDYLEVEWGPVESMLWIMQRLEETLRIPLNKWRLAGDGMILNPGVIVGGSSAFRHENIELYLVPGNMLRDYTSNNAKIHSWKKLPLGTTSSSNPLEKAKALFHLIEPQASSAWKTYLGHRKQADTELEKIMESFAGEDYDPLLEQIRDAVTDVIEYTDFDEAEQHSLFDGVVPFTFDTRDDWEDVINADVLTRIFSVTKPATVDVYFIYHHLTRMHSVEFDCSLLYRVLNPITSSKLDLPPEGSRPQSGCNGWKTIFNLGLADMPPGTRRWRPIHEMEWGLQASDVTRIHTALFGNPAQSPGDKIEKIDTVRLLLAAAGIPFMSHGMMKMKKGIVKT